MLDLDVNWFTLPDFPDIPEVKEDGATFIDNARKKAAGYAKATGIWTIADDSGLVIDALGGAPGIESARFSGEKGADRTLIDHKNIAKALTLLEDIPPEKRTARFVCSLCLARPEPAEGACPARPACPERSRREPVEWACPARPACPERSRRERSRRERSRREPVEGASPDQILIETQGTLEGLITDKEIGENGFGYDPIFFVPNLKKTVAQLTREEKNEISHRGCAIRKLKPLLKELLCC